MLHVMRVSSKAITVQNSIENPGRLVYNTDIEYIDWYKKTQAVVINIVKYHFLYEHDVAAKFPGMILENFFFKMFTPQGMINFHVNHVLERDRN